MPKYCKIRYQASAWDGKCYRVISVPKFKTAEEAIDNARHILEDRSNESVSGTIRRYWKDKPIIAEPRYFECEVRHEYTPLCD